MKLGKHQMRMKKLWVKLRSTYTQEDLLFENRELGTVAKLKKWIYLDKLTPFTSVDDNKEVSLFIGGHFISGLKPRELISNENDGEGVGVYTFKKLLDCCVLGPLINQTRTSMFGCGRIMFISAKAVKPGSAQEVRHLK